MRATWPRYRDWCTLLLLASPALKAVSATPTARHLVARGDDAAKKPIDEPDIQIPEKLRPQRRDDHLLGGDVSEAIQERLSELRPKSLADFPDYDPAQDPSQDGTVQPGAPIAETAAKTSILRSVGVEVPKGQPGQDVKGAFTAAANREYIFIELVDGTEADRTKKVKLTASSEEIMDIDSSVPWQAEHVLQLGIFSTIIGGKKPDKIDQGAWDLVSKVILGEPNPSPAPDAKEKETVPNKHSRVLGHILNDPVNVRGITFAHSSLRSAISAWAYGNDAQFGSWKSYVRSTAWAVYKYQKTTCDQSNEVQDKSLAALRSFINDDKKADPLVTHFKDEATRINTRIATELERVLELPPPEEAKAQDTPFKADDCANTRYTPLDGGDDSADKPITPGPPPAKAPYAEGVCTLHLTQTTTANTKAIGEYNLEASIADNDNHPIGQTSRPEPATRTHQLNLGSKLEDMLEMVPRQDHAGMVSFTLGAQKWDTTMNEEGKVPFCKRSTDTTLEGGMLKKEYECRFVCTWEKGKSSDGSN